MKEIHVKEGKNLYLSAMTLAAIKERDSATRDDYKVKRNIGTKLVRQDKKRCNMAKLVGSENDSKVLWELANSALGKQRSSLPSCLTLTDGSKTVGDAAAAEAMKLYYESRVLKLRVDVADALPALTPSWPPKAETGQAPGFSFSFDSAGKVAKMIRKLKNTEALGIDGIPVSILKKGVSVLATPIAHLVNRSLAEGVVPAGFKTAQIHPVHKGAGKSRTEPSSYRPVAILSALSKILEGIVKYDLEKYLAAVNGLPKCQFGFRSRRGCTTALGTAQAAWLRGTRAGLVVGVMAFDLSAAFDTIAAARLLPKLEQLGIRGRALSWLAEYLSGRRQCVVWSTEASTYVSVE
jgi:hypothetical protein